ncbi:unnamed protein product [Fraxinus pennsylvanica]|uniref:Uncharacterized protein n=1 Tax=Fraxinus pennsylvanica TaxID=56036 RepID=A0AAD1YVV6_9LAMI|nr:unnamed protein product [Fraxinus pennsylvanica]
MQRASVGHPPFPADKNSLVFRNSPVAPAHCLQGYGNFLQAQHVPMHPRTSVITIQFTLQSFSTLAKVSANCHCCPTYSSHQKTPEIATNSQYVPTPPRPRDLTTVTSDQYITTHHKTPEITTNCQYTSTRPQPRNPTSLPPGALHMTPETDTNSHCGKVSEALVGPAKLGGKSWDEGRALAGGGSYKRKEKAVTKNRPDFKAILRTKVDKLKKKQGMKKISNWYFALPLPSLNCAVPDNGSFSLFTPISFANNLDLCAPVTARPCPGSPPFSPPPISLLGNCPI